MMSASPAADLRPGTALWEQLAIAVDAGSASVSVLRAKRGNVRTLRCEVSHGTSVVAKVCDEVGWRVRLRRLLRRTRGRHEAEMLGRLEQLGIPCPRLLAYLPRSAHHPETVFLEDLGDVCRAVDVLTKLVTLGHESEAAAVESQLVDITRRMLHAGICDPDHSLMNMVVDARGRVFRLDMELAREVRRGRRRVVEPMLRRLIHTHAIACASQPARSAAFVERLEQELPLRPQVVAAAARLLKHSLPGIPRMPTGSPAAQS